METYEAAFHKIKELTGEDDLDLLVNRFISVEDTNFALFNYVNEQNNEIEKLNDEIQGVSCVLCVCSHLPRITVSLACSTVS